MIEERPYPGLRPFREDEAEVFFGREEQTDQLLGRLDKARFLAVVGSSGCGKSSLVRAGMIPSLRTGFMRSAGARWRIAQMRPGSHPMSRLAEALLEEGALGPERRAMPDPQGFLTAMLGRGPLGLVEVLRETPLPENTNLLLLVDQFEEIFRFRREGNRDDADAFVALLLETCRHPEVSTYVVMTMRSDFLGDCALFAGLPEVLNDSQFLTPRLTREQRREAIVGPARVFGGDVEPALINRLLNEMGNDPDQLPVLQHLLMRMWTCATIRECAARRILTLREYEAVGGIKDALSRHADEAYSRLDAEHRRVAEILFRRLSEQGALQRSVRRPTPVAEVGAVAQVAVRQVIDVAEVFRDPDTSFLVPALPEPLYPNTILDISHESLIRQWGRLRGWAQEEAESAKTYRFLEETASRWERRKAALWGVPNLDNARVWKDEQRPTEAWASRYGGDFGRAMRFLDTSEKAYEETQKRAHLQRLAVVRRWQWMAVSMALLVVGMAGAGYWYFLSEPVEYYRELVKRWGSPEGIGESLSANEVAHRALSLQLKHQGGTGPVKTVMAVNSRGQCTPWHGIGTYLKSTEEADPIFRACRWEFIRDDNNKVIYEKAYNHYGELIWVFAYSPDREDTVRDTAVTSLFRQGYFIGPDGLIQSQRKSSTEYVIIVYDTLGLEKKLTYLDRNGHPQRGLDNSFGRTNEYDDQGRVTRMTSLDQSGHPMIDSAGNATLESKLDEDGNTVEAIALDDKHQPVLLRDGYYKLTAVYDDYGNNNSWAYYGMNEEPVLHKDGSHSGQAEYDDQGHELTARFFGTNREPILTNEGYHKRSSTYDAKGNLTQQSYYGTNEEPIIEATDFHQVVMQYDDKGNALSFKYFDIDQKATVDNRGVHEERTVYGPKGHLLKSSYFDIKGQPVSTKDGYARVANHYDKRGNKEQWSYWDIVGQPAVDKAGGVHKEFAVLNDRGNQEFLAYFDSNGQPTIHKELNYHKKESEYDERGNAIKIRYHATDGSPANGNEGYHEKRSVYDERSQQISEAYFDANGAPVANKDGIHKTDMRYDSRGDVVEWIYFDGSNGRAANSDHVHRTTVRRDEKGQIVEEARFNVEGGRTVSKEQGHHIVRMKYDERGNPVEKRYFDVQDRPMIIEDGYFKLNTVYDARGYEVENRWFDTEDRPVTSKAKGCHRFTAEYNARGNRVEEACFDEQGSAILRPDEYHKAIAKYDHRGNFLELAFFGISQEAIVPEKMRYHKVVWGYDGQDRWVNRAFYDAKGQPMLGPDQYHRASVAYDERGIAEEVQSGFDGSLGFHTRVIRYDEQGRETYHGYRDAIGGPAATLGAFGSGAGFSEDEYVYDREGQLSALVWRGYGPEWGFAEMRALPAGEGEGFKVEFFDARGKPVETEAFVCEILEKEGEKKARQIGLRAGDVLVRYEGAPVTDWLRFIYLRKHESAAEPAKKLIVRRAGRSLTFALPAGQEVGMILASRGVGAPGQCSRVQASD